MTDAEKSPPAESYFAPHHFSGRHPKIFVGAICVAAALAIVTYLGWLFVEMHAKYATTATPSSTAVVVQLEQRVAAVEQKIQSLDSRVDELGARVDKNSSVSVSTELPEPQSLPAPAPPAVPVETPQTARLQSDMTALSAALAALQAEVKQTGSAATQTQQGVQSSLAAAIAFLQMQDAAAAGRGFASELAALRGVAGSGFQELLTRLDPYAAKGAPTVDALREEFFGLETKASVALAKATAQNWQERLLADLKGLVSIRPVHGGASPDDFSAAETALVSGDLSGALDAVKSLPAEAQAAFADWKSKAEARREIDAAMHAIADRFIAQAPPAPAASQD